MHTKLVDPQAGNIGKRVGLAAIGAAITPVQAPSCPVGAVHTLHQCRRQRRRGQDHACAKHAGPMHEAGEGGQVVEVVVVQLVQDEIGAHQPQHRRDLPSGP